jgi:hypothetical protein
MERGFRGRATGHTDTLKEKEMARREKTVVMDGHFTPVHESASVGDVVPVQASQIITHKGEVIPRSRFATVPVPEAFDVYLSKINKG